MTPIFFAKQSDFRKWLQKNHKKETELLVGFYKVGSGKPSMSWSQSVDEALCFGWIDSVRKSHWVMSAKQEATRIKRLNQLISESAAGTNQWKDNKYKK